jgi:hypothetical protein
MLTDAKLTEAEKVRVRHHLDYLNIAEAHVMGLGVPTAITVQFALEGAMDRVKVEALGLVRELIGKCDAIESQMFENTENQAVTDLGNIKINKEEFDQLQRGPLRYFQSKLATALGVLPNPLSPTGTFGGGGINVKVCG